MTAGRSGRANARTLAASRMSSFALRLPRAAEWRGWLPALALPALMFIALLALGGDRWHFYRWGGIHDSATGRTLTIAENLSFDNNFSLATRVWRDEDGDLRHRLYSRFPVGGFVLARLATLPFGDGLADKLLAARILAMLMFCGAAACAYLAIARIAGSRRIALAAVPLAFSGFYTVYYADALSSETTLDLFGAALVFHGMTVFIQEGRFPQLLVKTCAALLLGWHVYALLLPFIALGLGGEAVSLLRSAVSSNGRAGVHQARAALISLIRSRYAALAAVAILFGSALLAFNFANEYASYRGERALSETPLFDSAMRRFGQTERYEGYPELEWGNFLRRQLYRAGVISTPYAVVRAAGYDFPTYEPLVAPLAPMVLGAAAACAALAATAFARRCRILLASAVLFGFCWSIPMRYQTFPRDHFFESLSYVWLALALFALALIGARRLMGERLGERALLGVCAAAALIFALSVFWAGRLDRDAGEIRREKAEMAEFDAIRETTREKRVILFKYDSLGFLGKYYLLGSYRLDARENVCAPRVEDFAVSAQRDESLNLITPEHRFAFLYEAAAGLDLCRAERRRLESSQPAARSAFDLYLQDGALSYLKAPCEPSDYEAPFYAYAYPVDSNALLEADRQNGYSELRRWRTWLPDGTAAFDGACLMARLLPSYPISAIRTGQRDPGGERLWEVLITPPPSAETLALREKIYRTAASGEPAARAEFDLYLDGEALTYLKEPCAESDARGRFFLSVHPKNIEDLSAKRREAGYDHDSLNFTFAPPAGAVFNGKCMARRQLPDYDIAKIETGQWIPGGERLWDAEIAVGD